MNLEKLNHIQNSTNNLEISLLKDNFNAIFQQVKDHPGKPVIVNAGLLKAGKSTLFNAIADKEHFSADVVRSTVSNKRIELENYFLIDTPGLDANKEDTHTAFEAYKTSDIIIFVHNVQEGELNKIEVDCLKSISDLFCSSAAKNTDSTVNIKLPAILVLSHADQLDAQEVQELQKKITSQIKSLFKTDFEYVISVNSTGYIKGIVENKKMLIDASNIVTLKEFLNEFAAKLGDKSCFISYINNQIREFINSVSQEENNLLSQKAGLKGTADTAKNPAQVKEQILQILSATVEKLKSEANIPKPEFTRPSLKHYARSYKDYKSSSDAKRAAKESCLVAIKDAAKMIRTQLFDTVAYYENYLAPDGKLNTVKNELFSVYNQIKELSYQAIKDPKNIPPFAIELNFNTKLFNGFKNDFDVLFKGSASYYEYAKYFSAETFKSVDHYLTSYDANMYIDYDYRTEYVDGWFGSKEKEVKYYNWEIDGAIDDIMSDSPELYDGRINSLREKTLKLYAAYINSYIEQMQTLVAAFTQKIDQEISSFNNNRQQIHEKTSRLDKQIVQLSQIKADLERILA